MEYYTAIKMNKPQLRDCYRLNVCVPYTHTDSYVEILTPNVMVGGGAFGGD